MIAPWLTEPGVRPITHVAAMANLRNRVRPWVEGGHVATVGLLPVGDAAFITNPAHTRGTTLAVLSAVRLAEVVQATADPVERALRLDAFLRTELLPWFHDSCAQDDARLSRWRAQAQSEVPNEASGRAARQAAGVDALAGMDVLSAVAAGQTVVSNGEAFTAAHRDPHVWFAFTRLQNLLEMPRDILDDPTFTRRVRTVLTSGWMPPRQPAPSRDELIDIATAATTGTGTGTGSGMRTRRREPRG
jgi:hypothetical protein